MRISYDKADDAMYIRFSETEYYQSDEVKEGVILDFDKDGRIIALELLDVSKRLPRMSMDSVNFEVNHPELRKNQGTVVQRVHKEEKKCLNH